MKIETRQDRSGRWLTSASICIAVIFGVGVALPRVARTSPIPGLSAVLTATGTVSLTVTNGVTNEYYTIFTQDFLDTNFPWSGSITGRLGQTNFSVPIGQAFRFFRAESGVDRDGDGIENYRDADPNSTNVNYALRVIIESPTNGANIY